MPDPQRDIAPIIEPAAPPLPPPGPDITLAIGLAACGLLLATWLYWHWRKRAPLRALRKIAHAPDTSAGADALAALMSMHGAEMPQIWQDELDRLRFGPPLENADAVLLRLCQGAELMLRRR
ncbi:MAG: hypothetical protein AB1591_09220 [Pseudomonadota bacterium]